MKRVLLTKQTAGESGGQAGSADQMYKAVDQIVRALRSGQAARLPGLGTLSPGKRWVFKQDPNER